MRGSTLLPALLRFWPGFGLHSCNLPTFGPGCRAIGGRADDDGPGLTMTKNRALFLLPKLWPSFHPLLLVPVLRAPSLAPGSLVGMALYLLPIFWGRFTQS